MTKLAALAIALTALASGANARETYVKMPEFLIGSWCKSDDSGSDTSFWNVNSMGRAGRRTITKCVLVSLPPPPTAQNPNPRGNVIPGTFRVLVFGM
jgi:hypothetical protein